jgi:hypothetical protein
MLGRNRRTWDCRKGGIKAGETVEESRRLNGDGEESGKGGYDELCD